MCIARPSRRRAWDARPPSTPSATWRVSTPDHARRPPRSGAGLARRSALEVAARLSGGDDLPLLDVREPHEHAWVALPASILIPLNELPDRLHELEAWQDREFVVYCHHGVRSAHAVAWLRGQGFQGARNLAGGIDRWSLEIDPSLRRY